MPVPALYQFGQTPNSAVFRYRKSRVVELPNSEVFVLFPLLASVCYNVWNIECLENLWGEYVRKWLNLFKIDDNSWQSKKNRAVVSIRVSKGKSTKTSEFGSSTTPKLPISEDCRIRGLPELISMQCSTRSQFFWPMSADRNIWNHACLRVTAH